MDRHVIRNKEMKLIHSTKYYPNQTKQPRRPSRIGAAKEKKFEPSVIVLKATQPPEIQQRISSACFHFASSMPSQRPTCFPSLYSSLKFLPLFESSGPPPFALAEDFLDFPDPVFFLLLTGFFCHERRRQQQENRVRRSSTTGKQTTTLTIANPFA